MLQLEMEGFEKPGTFKAKAEYFTKSHGGYSCTIWTLDNFYVSSGHGATKEKAKINALKKYKR